MNFIKKIYAAIGILDRAMAWLSPLFLLGLRVYVANAFFKSGLTKIQDFSSTVALFENEYKVPIISPTLAAASGTVAELVLPALLVAGLASRPTALALFVRRGPPPTMPAGPIPRRYRKPPPRSAK